MFVASLLGRLHSRAGEFVQLTADPAVTAGALLVAGRVASAASSGRARSTGESAGSGRHALRAAKRVEVSAPLGSVASVKGPDKFQQCFVPHSRVILCDSDLLALDATLPSVSRVLPSSGSLSRSRASVACGARGVSACCSRCGGALVGGIGALCRVCAEDVRGSVANSGDDHCDHNSWKHGQSLGSEVGRSFVGTVVVGAALAQYPRGAPEGVQVEAWEGRLFTVLGPQRGRFQSLRDV